MSKVKLLTISVALLLILNIGTLSFLSIQNSSRMPLGPRGVRREGPKRMIAERLHLDKDQVARYEQLIKMHRTEVEKLEKDIWQTKNSLYATLIEDAHSGKDSLEHRLGEIQTQMEAVHYDHFLALKKLCKPEQQLFFNELTGELTRFFAHGKNFSGPPKD